jgi:NitT/TauT family transport system permease protein
VMVEAAISSSSSERKARFRRAVRDGALRTLPGIAILCLWQVASGRVIRENYVSKPTEIARRLYDLFASGEIWPSLQVTGQELILSYVFGVVSGMVLGYVLGRAPKAARIVEPYLMAFYGIPKIALAPLFVIWFGIGVWSKVMLAGTMVFFLVFYNVFAGVRSVDREMVNLALVLGANERQLGRQIYLPATAPFLLLGMRMAIPYAVIGVIVGEFTASTAGLGLFINYASSTYDLAGVFAGIFILLGFVMTMSAIADRIERRILRWRPSTYTPSGDAA